MIQYRTNGNYPTVTNPKTTPCAINPSTLEDLYDEVPDTTPGHIETSIRHGLGAGLTLPIPKAGMGVVKDLRRAMNAISKNDIALGSDLLYNTFDQDFCDLIGGYPKDALLWFKHDEDKYDLVRSLVGDNVYNFVDNPSYIDGVHWEWAVKNKTTSSGYPLISQSSCVRPFDNNITIGKENGSSIISDIYVPETDRMIYASGSATFTYDSTADIPSSLNPEMLNGRLNGSVPFSFVQVFLCVSNLAPNQGSGQAYGLARGYQPNIACYMNRNCQIRYKKPNSTYGEIDMLKGLFNVFDAGSGYVSDYIVPNVTTFDKTNIAYYPIFTNSMGRRTIMIPVKAGQYVFLGMTTISRYAITSLSIDVRSYGFANFDGSEYK